MIEKTESLSRAAKRTKRIAEKKQNLEEMLHKFFSKDLDSSRAYYSDDARVIFYERMGKLKIVKEGESYNPLAKSLAKLFGINCVGHFLKGWHVFSINATSAESKDRIFCKARLDVTAKANVGKIHEFFHNGVGKVEVLYNSIEEAFEKECSKIDYTDINRFLDDISNAIVEKMQNLEVDDIVFFNIKSVRIGHITAVDEKVRETLEKELHLIQKSRYLDEQKKHDMKEQSIELEKQTAKNEQERKQKEYDLEIQEEIEAKAKIKKASTEAEVWKLNQPLRESEESYKQKIQEMKNAHEIAMEQTKNTYERLKQQEEYEQKLELEAMKHEAEKAELTGENKAAQRTPSVYLQGTQVPTNKEE